jgi:hypothetical protein
MKYNIYQSNNDYELGIEDSEAASDAGFEMKTACGAWLAIRADKSKEQALEDIDNLRWLVEQSYAEK